MGDGSPRPLYHGPLLPPTRGACSTSYTQRRLESGKIGVKNERKDKVNVVEFSSTMVPMPFLEALAIRQRTEAEKKGKGMEEKGAGQGEGS
ncbi:uncharacterized protein L3040_007697 [Drepanopeziza brunnea f. sp. 'multigermtubi']|uniref:uncharacterized protein n=1 Tax=Drepanopeziza brunnea f. sp. 'multigermtubi' TaxID=698441 RepID=UPI002391A690|nr:hypothetical protein L3040_007697 [Drepanopeziza brunnea f. sp. 'multigermtubi']